MMNDCVAIKGYDWTNVNCGQLKEFTNIVKLNCIENMGLHLHKGELWTSGYIGVCRLRDYRNQYLKFDGKDVVLYVSPRFAVDPYKMLNEVIKDEEYDSYMRNDKENPLFRIFEREPLIETTDSKHGGEILLAISFVKTCEYVCKKKLKSCMSFYECNLNSKVKGKIQFSKHISKNICSGREDKVYCRYSEFSIDTPENRILKAALFKADAIIKKSGVDMKNLNTCMRYCKTVLDNVRTVPLGHTLFNSAKTTGMYSYYKKPIAMAKLIHEKGNLSADYIENGERKYKVIPYVINMEKLFEFYVRTLVRKELDENHRLVKYDEKIALLANPENKKTYMMDNCKPDIIIEDCNNKCVSVYDVKYKDRSHYNEGRRHDSHQLLSYTYLLDVSKCGFIMPAKLEDNQGKITELKTGTQRNFEKPVIYYEYLVKNE